MYMQGTNGGLGEIDWSGIIKDVVGGYTAVKTVQSQTKLTQAQIEAAKAQPFGIPSQLPANLQYQLNPQYSGNYGMPPQPTSNLMPILLLGGAALVLFMVMK